MIYKLRHFENNFQIISSLGWGLIVLGIISFFVGPLPVSIIAIVIGALLVLLQLRGKRITVDTEKKSVIAGNETIKLINPTMVFMNEVKMSQTVSSRGSTTNVKMYFYKAFIHDGEYTIMISCNRSESRDLEKLEQIAKDLNVPFQKNFE